uniref:Dioxygenase n=1 Tax=Heterorhabditis bacteriophora TaxID=37862 RepID=A0A1I7WZM5_HETBA
MQRLFENFENVLTPKECTPTGTDMRVFKLEYHVVNMAFVDQSRKMKMARGSFLNKSPQENFIFQQVNIVIHMSCSTKDWFRRRNIALMDWPTRNWIHYTFKDCFSWDDSLGVNVIIMDKRTGKKIDLKKARYTVPESRIPYGFHSHYVARNI